MAGAVRGVGAHGEDVRRAAPRERRRVVEPDSEARVAGGVDLEAQCRWGSDALLGAGFDRVDYFEFRDTETLEPAEAFRPGLRIFAAAWLRGTRLIDNLAVDEIE